MTSKMELKLPRSFFARPALEVARDIVGRKLVHVTDEGTVAGIVVEAEAYTGVEDPASHAYAGRRTRRNDVMWGPPGFAYVYPIYGMYLCFNVVCGQVGEPQGTFLRAVRPTEGQDLMAIRRGFSVLDEKSERQLCNGPSKLCQAFGITRSLNGVDVCGEALFFTTGTDPGTVIAAWRVGIDYAGPGREWPWRFLVQGDPYVSKRP
jgi:DNA-3-methyladenine glycosylase